MKKALMLLLLPLAVGAAFARPEAAAPQPASGAAVDAESYNDLERFKMALSDERRKLFGAAMSKLSAQQLETFWSVYADYEKEKGAITSARLDLAKEYVDMYTGAKGIDDAGIGKVVNEMGALQKKNTDLRLKYFGILSQKLDAKAAGRFALVDDYITTAWRLDLLEHIPAPGDEVIRK
ncbi:MAG TPA: hypothetical protein VFW45_16820 [Candidatus Polarisedimenticolia bacterium]|nr:hypothetical protein [Candidatus Polarisedimenticolia bacterium]